MSSPAADRNLLFGILAVQLDFVSRDALIDAMNAWLLDKAKPLGHVLRDLGHLPPGRLELLDALVAEHLRQHGDDPRQSLAALSSVEPRLARRLAELPDGDVRQTLVQVAAARQETPEVDGAGTLLHNLPAAPSTGVRYRVVRPHKKGGLGEVFVAEDTELGRRVALKEIQDRYADDGPSRSRFVLEAEITGGLEHPGIVPVYGLGAYGNGRPYYAMRFIQGDNLQDAIKRFHGTTPDFASLAFRDLLSRFVDVCNAVAYAHSRGVLHRDLKPGNVMLGKYGETLLVDWGLAKATGRAAGASDQSGDATLRPRAGGEPSATVAGQAMGTPAYMSPEQAAGRLDDLGPATDVYSLGATLYELLTGQVAFAGRTVTELLDAVKAGNFPPPRAAQAAVPAALEAVCLKAMALTPAGRYAGALALARDLERWLADDPVAAYPEPAGVRARRWARRHARLVTGVAAALGVGMVALGLLAWQKERARQQVAAEAAQKERARAEAEARLGQVQRANDILGSVFADLDPKKAEKDGKPLQAVLGERLDRATAEIEGEAIGDALTVARVQTTLGQSQLGLGYAAKAVRLFEAARATRAARLGPDHPDTLASMGDLAAAYQDAGRLAEALPLYEEALRLSTARLGPDHPDTLQALSNLALGRMGAGRYDAALPLLEDALRRRTARLGRDHPDTLTTMNSLAQGRRAAGQLDAALALWGQALPLLKAKLGPDHPDTLTTMNALADGYRAAGRLADALPLSEESLRLLKAKLGPGHPDTLLAMSNLATGFQAVGRHADALPLMEEAQRLLKAKFDPDHPHVITGMNNLAGGYLAAGRLGDALPLWEEALRRLRATLGPDHPNTLSCLGNLADGYRAAGRLAEALPLWEEALRLSTAKLGPDHPDTLTRVNNLAVGYKAVGRLGDALPLLEGAVRSQRATLGPDHPDTLTGVSNLAKGYLAAGRAAEALPLLEEALERRTAKLGPDHVSTLQSMNGLAEGYRVVGRTAEALRLWEEALRLTRARLGPDHAETLRTLNNLAVGYRDAGRPGEALPLTEEAFRLMKAKFGPDHPDTLVGMSNLAVSYRIAGRLGEAVPLYEEVLRLRRAKLGPDHPDTLQSMTNLAAGYLAAGRLDAAERLLRDAVALTRQASGGTSPPYAAALAALGLNLLQQKRWADAEPVLRECLTLRQKAQPDAWTTFATASMLGDSLLGQGKPTEAEPLLLAGYGGLRRNADKVPAGAKARLPEAAERLVRLYDGLGKADEAAKYRNELEALKATPAKP